MREAYRLNKHLLASQSGIHFLIGYVYIGAHKLCSFKKIQAKLVSSLQFLDQLHASQDHDSV